VSDCAECNELRRNLIAVTSEQRQLVDRTRARHASAPERRRIHRLKTDAHIARELLQNHLAICEETHQ
jgi:predicted nucleotidyltransferase